MRTLSALFLALLCIVAVHGVKVDQGLQFRQVNRHIDLSSQNARHTISITIVSSGVKSSSQFYYTLHGDIASHLAYLRVVTEAGKELSVGPAERDDKNFVYYAVDLGRSLEPDDSMTITVHMVLTHVLTPYPAQITQNDKQFVKYADNHYIFTPYSVSTQKTVVKCASFNIEKHSELSPTILKGDTITYGPYVDVEPFTSSPLHVHFENQQPFITITSLTREIEISHWGNVAITEDIDMRNDGAKLQGSFSRFDYQRNPKAGQSAIRSITQLLPPSARELYYRDEIGNISTSQVFHSGNKVHLELVPRYPMFGGWKTRFYIGYDLPIQNFVFNDASDWSRFMLNISFSPEFESDVVIDELVVRVILPEGAKNHLGHLPFPVDKQSEERHFTYLDTMGRPVLVIHKKNVVPEHANFFQVTYNFSRLSMLQEPLLLVFAYFAFFVVLMFYVRFELSITKEETVVAEKDTRLVKLLLKLRDIHAQRSELHNSLLQASKKLGKTKTAAFTQEKKVIDASMDKCHTDMLKINNELEELDETIAAQVRQIERQEQAKQSYLDQLLNLDASYREKRMAKSAYEESKAQFEKFYNKVDEEIDRLVADLTDDL